MCAACRRAAKYKVCEMQRSCVTTGSQQMPSTQTRARSPQSPLIRDHAHQSRHKQGTVETHVGGTDEDIARRLARRGRVLLARRMATRWAIVFVNSRKTLHESVFTHACVMLCTARVG